MKASPIFLRNIIISSQYLLTYVIHGCVGLICCLFLDGRHCIVQIHVIQCSYLQFLGFYSQTQMYRSHFSFIFFFLPFVYITSLEMKPSCSFYNGTNYIIYSITMEMESLISINKLLLVNICRYAQIK